MIFWFIVGFLVWILCVSFMLVIIKGGHRVRGNKYEQKLYFRSLVNTRNKGNSRKKDVRQTTKTWQKQRVPVS